MNNSELVQQGYWHPVQIGDGQNETYSFHETCRGHQWSKTEQGRILKIFIYHHL